MPHKRCTNCNREMGYSPPSDECAPCELGYPKPFDWRGYAKTLVEKAKENNGDWYHQGGFGRRLESVIGNPVATSADVQAMVKEAKALLGAVVVNDPDEDSND